MKTLYLEVTELGEVSGPRETLFVQQANLTETQTIGIELSIPNRPQSEWACFYPGIPHASILESDSLRRRFARVRVTDEADARAAWAILKPWFDGIPVLLKIHEHYDDAPCKLIDFSPEVINE